MSDWLTCMATTLTGSRRQAAANYRRPSTEGSAGRRAATVEAVAGTDEPYETADPPASCRHPLRVPHGWAVRDGGPARILPSPPGHHAIRTGGRTVPTPPSPSGRCAAVQAVRKASVGDRRAARRAG
ncbi:hypothetical protein GCM10023191_058830 [Actinoallomurus oryzae]|uniref:Uncharacterized protein n=1 Tax=Actinoallomurus oryzae TaxID=502180 RepID=A0ABP8QL85_9ACTN